MANSRSNIYPVQLQGAELNLNKFDAEIKQYSGFNKNNSPFVGGCLSNLFTKTEENTTGSSDSVYVDDNGDVYEAKVTHLYKNGKILFDISNPYKIFSLNVPSDTIYATVISVQKNGETSPHDEPLYIRVIEISNSSAWFKLYFEDLEQDINLWLFDENENGVNIEGFDVEVGRTYVTAIDYQLPFLIRLRGTKNNKVYMTGAPCILRCETTDSVEVGPYLSHHVNKNDYMDIPLFVRDSDNQNFYYSFYGLDETYDFEGNRFTVAESGSSSKTTCIGKSKYIFLLNKVYLVDVTNYTTSGSQSIMINAEYAVDYNNKTITLDKDNGYSSASYASGINLSVKLGKVDNNYDLRGCYALKFSDNKLFYGIAGAVITDKVTLVDDGNGTMQAMMYLGAESQGLLFNNGILTGIGSSVLFTDWNSVEKVFISDNGYVYKDTNTKWWRIKNVWADEGDKYIIKKINGFIVTNSETGNCYRLSDDKVLRFAPTWNNRAFDDGTTITKSGTAITDNTGYMATSINEYKLKDNASILLNPVPVIKLPTVTYNYPMKDSYANSNDRIINVYAGTDSEIIYKYSFKEWDEAGKLRFYPDLKDLPFPINTSGNVQLSPSLFCKTERFGNDVFIKEGSNAYQLIKEGSESVMSYYLGTLIENLEDIFILQGQYYAIIDKQIFNVQFSGGVVQSLSFVVSVENLQFCGNSAYQAYFFSKTNRCIYVFTGANILNQLQLVDKISEIYAYKYNQSTQSIILITDLGTIVSSNLGMYLIEGFTPDDVFFYDKGVVFVSDSELTYLQYYEADGFEKHNIEVETCFYGMNNETVTINDCLYFRLFSEEHEEGEVKVSATTISLKGRKTETTVFKFKASDWDALTHSVYVRYQPKEQRGLGISFSIDSPFKIASLSVGSKADAILVDKVSKGAVITPSNNDEW